MKIIKKIPKINSPSINREMNSEELRAHNLVLRRRRAKGIPQLKTVISYTGVFIVLALAIMFSYKPSSSNVVNKAATVQNTDAQTTVKSVDTVVASELAANLAQATEIPVSADVTNLAASNRIVAQLTSESDSVVITKPQILQPTASNRSVISYTVVDGDTVSSIASKFNLSATTIKWANDLTSDSVSAGKILTILPINGIYYTVKSSDTIDSLASKYKTDAARIISYNDLEINGLSAGSKIIIPDGVLPNNERPGYVAPFNYYSYAVGYSGGNVTLLYRSSYQDYINSLSHGNGMAPGNCTWYVWERRYSMGGVWSLPTGGWGNAATWASYLGSVSYRVDRTPSFGAIMQNGGGYGHVAFVESVDGNGDITVTEMNYDYQTFVVDRRVIPATYAGNYNYIHEKIR